MACKGSGVQIPSAPPQVRRPLRRRPSLDRPPRAADRQQPSSRRPIRRHRASHPAVLAGVVSWSNRPDAIARWLKAVRWDSSPPPASPAAAGPRRDGVLTCEFSLPVVTAHARREPGVPGVMRTQRGPERSYHREPCLRVRLASGDLRGVASPEGAGELLTERLTTSADAKAS